MVRRFSSARGRGPGSEGLIGCTHDDDGNGDDVREHVVGQIPGGTQSLEHGEEQLPGGGSVNIEHRPYQKKAYRAWRTLPGSKPVKGPGRADRESARADMRYLAGATNMEDLLDRRRVLQAGLSSASSASSAVPAAGSAVTAAAAAAAPVADACSPSVTAAFSFGPVPSTPTLEDQYHELATQYNVLETELAQARIKLRELQMEHGEAVLVRDSQIDDLSTALQWEREENQELRMAVSDLQTQVAELQLSNQQLEEQVVDLEWEKYFPKPTPRQNLD